MITEITLGVPLTEEAQQRALDQGYTLQPFTGPFRGRYVMGVRRPQHQRWTAEETATLERLWGFKTARKIGKMLGRSKGSVIGKADRLGLRGLQDDRM